MPIEADASDIDLAALTSAVIPPLAQRLGG